MVRMGEDGARMASSDEQGKENDRRKNFLPANNLSYKERDYWDRRFKTEEDYDVRTSFYYTVVVFHVLQRPSAEYRVCMTTRVQ